MDECLQLWREHMATYPVEMPRILWTGAKRWEGSPIEDHSVHAPRGIWVGTDIESGEGVDLVADLHYLDVALAKQSQGFSPFDAIFSPATLEHVERPWIVMDAISKSLRPGGLLYLQTHQTFPLHGYPNDFYRFSAEALASLARASGLIVKHTCYYHPCVIQQPPDIDRWNTAAPAWLNVCLFALKPD